METIITLPPKNPSAAMPAPVAQSSSKSRTLKIQPLIRSTRWDSTTVPEIRLSGAWLEKFGFRPGGHVEVKMADGMLVITPASSPATNIC